jgi:hypothetical protein
MGRNLHWSIILASEVSKLLEIPSILRLILEAPQWHCCPALQGS